jgi:hypothetical protein
MTRPHLSVLSKARTMPRACCLTCFCSHAGLRAFNLRPEHEPPLAGIERRALVHHAAVVPHHEIADAPLLKLREFFARGMRPQTVEQSLALVQWKSDDIAQRPAAEIERMTLRNGMANDDRMDRAGRLETQHAVRQPRIENSLDLRQAERLREVDAYDICPDVRAQRESTDSRLQRTLFCGKRHRMDLWVANSQYDRMRLCRAVLHAMAVVVMFAPCVNSSSSPFTCSLLSRNSFVGVASTASPRSHCCSCIN